MSKEQYYLVKKERLDAYIKDDEINSKATLLSDMALIDLSDEAIERAAFHDIIGYDEGEGYRCALNLLKVRASKNT